MRFSAFLISFLLLSIPVLAQSQIPGFSELERLGLPDILLWLLTFAIMYGIMTQISLPKDRGSRAIISIVVAFLVLLAAPARMITILSQMTSSLVLTVIVILMFIVFLEAAKIQVTRKVKVKDPQSGKSVWVPQAVALYVKHPYAFAFVVLIIAALIFFSSGGADVLGINVNVSSTTAVGALFLIGVILTVWWMASSKPQDEEE